MGAIWIDPDFDPSQPAFFYARVIKIPTPRWTAYDAFRMGAEVPGESPMEYAGARLHFSHLVHTLSLSNGYTP